MPLIDLSEAVSRGEIIVDEVDALNAVNSGKLSEIETARFSPLVAEHSRRQSGGGGAAAHEDADANGAVASDDEHAWDNVLVDEIDFVHAVERGQISRNDLHIIGHRGSGDTSMPQRIMDDSINEFGDSSQDESGGWNRVLVDEIDILHAVEQGARIVGRSECRLSHKHRAENGTLRSDRNGGAAHGPETSATATNEGVPSIQIARTNGMGRPGGGSEQ